ncbi:MAG: tetraacyldisaccharide 4'-kinase [Pseudomonadota bacterium]
MPRAPGFWTKPGHPLARLLSPLGAVVGLVAARRMGRPALHRPSMPVICIGNFVAGGQGKTPLALALAAVLKARGRDPVFLSRGYGGTQSGPLLIGHETAEDVGDEPLLLARAAPCIVARDRVAGARLAETLGLGAPVLILDDGFQNPALAKRLSLVAVDAGFGFGNGYVLPAGPLRAPLAAQWPQADAVVLIGERASADVEAAAQRAETPVLRASLQADRGAIASGSPLVAYAGIGRPAKFFDTLKGLGAALAATRAFPDHHAYTEEDARALLALAEAHGARLVTTEKDAARLANTRTPDLAALYAGSDVLPVALTFDVPDALTDLLREKGL